MNDEVTNYFEKVRSSIHVEFDEFGDTKDQDVLREAQAGAYWAVRAHFTESEEQCVVIMPTGSGKTALMTILSFSIVSKRLLIIAPSRVIREQIGSEFETLRVAKETGCIPDDFPFPKLKIVEKRLSTIQQWEALKDFDVVIATTACISPMHKGVFNNPPNDLFDTIFFDEAHHLPATTWSGIADHFLDSKIVSFTATPFRNDKRLIPGEFIYKYPLSRAIDRGIFRPIEFISVDGYGTKLEIDLRLATVAKEVWEAESQDTNAKLLVRVYPKKNTKPIQKLYQDIGLNLIIIDSDHSLEDNETAIANVLSDDDVHGLIAVGMLGEGLDLPVLKIAVMHAPHQSFPITLQFIGRICRTAEDVEGTSKLIAIPEEIQDHTKGLYDLDANWSELIPSLMDAAIGLEQERRQYSHEFWSMTEDSQVSLHTLRPSLTVCIYKIQGEVDIFVNPIFKGSSILYQEFTSDDRNWRVMITRTNSKPLWSTSKSIQDVNYDLHIYYQTGDLLFEHTSSPPIARDVRKSMGDNEIVLVEDERIQQIISQSPLIAYYNIGLRRVTYSSSTIPTYKMMTGTHAEDTIRAADGNFFSIGHIFGKVGWDDGDLVIGFSTQKAKIWSSTRNHIKEFTEWCDVIARIINNNAVESLPFIDHLKQPSVITEMSAEPFSIVLPQETYNHVSDGMRVEIMTDDGGIIFDLEDLPEIEIQHGSWTEDNPNQCLIDFHIGGQKITLTFDIQNDNVFRLNPSPPIIRCVTKVPVKGRNRLFELAEYFCDFPPIIYLSDGSAVVGRYHYPYRSRLNQIPDEILNSLDWEALNCDIGVEDMEMLKSEEKKAGMITAGRNDVLQATVAALPGIFPNPALAFIDHRTGEIADIIIIEEGEESPVINLIHCKASKTDSPGVNLENAHEVIHQARKSLRWMFKKDLFNEIRNRANEDAIITGSIQEFNQVMQGFTPQTINYAVYVVQPGFSINKLMNWSDESLRLIMLSLYDELHNQDVDFYIIGSE